MYELHTAETQIHSRVVYTRNDGLAWLGAKRHAQERRSTEGALDVWEAVRKRHLKDHAAQRTDCVLPGWLTFG